MLDYGNLEVGTLAIAIPMVDTAELNAIAPDWSETAVSLSRFAYQRQYDGEMVLESPLSKFRIRLLDWRASGLLALLAQPQSIATLTAFADLSPEIIQQFLHLLWATQFLTTESEPRNEVMPSGLSLQVWEFHNLLFHSRSRSGRHDYPLTHGEQFTDLLPQISAVKPPMSDKVVPLPRPNLAIITQGDLTLTEAIETRQSIREYDDTHPITLEQLGELLYRTARVKDIYQLDESQLDCELTHRPYPNGGSLYELEIYPVVRHCEGLESGLYHYDPLNHQLEKLTDNNAHIDSLITHAYKTSGEHDKPQVLLVMTARFERLFWKYAFGAYALIAKHVGVLYQNLYLVANSMGLASCGLGNGDSECFAQATGLDYIQESSVGEFMLGSLPRRDTTKPETETTVTKPIALHPHDLDDRLPGLANLRDRTLGDSRVTVVILDSNPNNQLSCFEGANLSKVFPHWHEAPEPISAEAYAIYRDIDNSDLKKEEKLAKIRAVLPEEIINRIKGDHHASHITSTIVGQENTPAPGIAPDCRVINIPLNTTGDNEEFISVLNLARGFELGLELGANIIHCAACRPTQTGEAQDLLKQAIKKCLDNNILIVAPAGNNKGECWCIPAVLPGVLAVGAMKDNGKPFKFSNWGGNYQLEGILAPGEKILGAQPGTEEPKRLTGTSMSAPVMTGIIALLMSLKLQQGKPIDAEAIRAALLNTAIVCDAQEVEEPERCLNGKLNLPGAMNLLFGQPSVSISFTGNSVTRIDDGHFIAASGKNEDLNNAPPLNPNLPATPYLPSSVSGSAAPILSNSPIPESASVRVEPDSASNPQAQITPSSITVAPSGVTPSTAHSGQIYALGTLGYDFGSEARRDSFKQLMSAVNVDSLLVPANPYDACQMVDYLDRNPSESRSLIWTVNMDLTPIYAIEPQNPFGAEIYEILLMLLAGQIEPEDSDEFVERVSIPARLTSRTVELFSGQVVPVIKLRNLRGIYGWKVNTLVDAALATIVESSEVDDIRRSLFSFLNRVYYDLRNLGQTSRDRALNFAATNAFQAASVFAQAIAEGRELDTIEVEKSPYCRLHSDCWDVKLKFFDPENSRRARKLYRFTIDVADWVPVTLGEVKSWSIPN
ncbi:PatA/PatG family cyanobactin maturation protease [Pleurocapsa sp. PCC 7319]|uniref:PatA/PatG family cyanobactin maturation protease n=1 Tax=Pleurocapsa sp. PCC 7319 TaxID=118161 RepID=UPI00034B8466|nr:PatA/PatG family cyanobactin maturation protease [Pleurocapsa sp. PCC 7319]